MATERELEQELTDLAHQVERLRVHYQQYFMGFEKAPPSVLREQLERRVRYSPLNDVHRAGLKFRFMSIVQRYRIYEVYWDRVVRDIEEGRVTRDVFRRNLDAPARGAKIDTVPQGPEAPPEALAVSRPSAPPATPEPRPDQATPEPRPDQATPEPRPHSPDPISALFREYVAAREKVGLPTAGITEGAFRAGLEKQRSAQIQRLGAADVSFSVAVRDGRVVLLARPLIPSEEPG